MQNCKKCSASFEISDKDTFFYEKVGVPSPTLCPDCRAQRRLSFRNERKFYQRKCDLTGKEIISVYSPDKPYKVYAQDVWWGDQWDPLQYGKEYNFSKSFFEQWNELFLQVPKVALMSRNSENCDYTNISADNKNCYILIESSNNEDCYYSYWMQKCRDCIDCSFCMDTELCYESNDCYNCYNLKYSNDCKNCRDSAFLKSCIGCKDCFGCINLQQKQYCIFNEQYSKEDYEEKIKNFHLDSYTSVQNISQEVQELYLKHPQKYSIINNSENVTGCYISNSRNCESCFHAVEAEDCKYCVHVWRNAKDSMDVDTAGRNAELIYESINTGIDVFHNLFCFRCWTCSEMLYCDNCDYCQDCFGCSGLRKKQYCILNKQYSKDEYEVLKKKIIEKMTQDNEFGEFFTAKYSPFGYNETVAQEYYPLAKEQALNLDFQWHEEAVAAQYQGMKYEVPDKISEVSDDVVKAIHACTETQKPFKIIPQELAFYRKMKIPVPRLCPDQRHLKRLALRLPRKLWERMCAKCAKAIKTPYEPGRSEIVYCEQCYLETVY